MKTQRWSVRLWRWNAYVIFVAGLLTIAMLVTGFVAIIEDEVDGSESGVFNVAADRVVQSATRIGEFEVVPGTSVLRAPLYLDQQLAATISKDATSVQNYLFHDPGTGASYWLLSGPATLLAKKVDFPSTQYGEPKLPVVAVAYVQVSRDTDGDERLTGADLKSIAFSEPTGRRFTPLLRDVSELHAAELTKDGKVVLIYTAGAKMRVATVDATTFRIVRESEVRGAPPAS